MKNKGGFLLVNIDGSKLTFDENHICVLTRETCPKELLSLFDFIKDESFDKKQLIVNFYSEDTDIIGGVMSRDAISTYELFCVDGPLLTISDSDVNQISIAYYIY